MRHFWRKNEQLLEDIRAYLLAAQAPQGEECTATDEDAFSDINTFFSETADTPPLCAPSPSSQSKVAFGAAPFDIHLGDKAPSFADNLFRLIDAAELKDSTVYKRADIDRRLFSKIRSDAAYHPSKNTAVKLCLALQLDIVQTERLLESAGYCLSMSDTSDLVVRYCIEHRRFRVTDVNEALAYFGAPLLT